MFQGTHFGGIVVADRAVHTGADGKRYLIIHGDQFDTVVMNVRWLAYLGDRAYELAMFANRVVARFRRLLGLPYWSLSSWAKVKVKQAVNFIGAFQDVLTEEAKRSDVDGVICGHIHHAAMETLGDVQYINTGDWVESCTAVVEHFDGRMEIVHWPFVRATPASMRDKLVPVTIGGRTVGRSAKAA
jgi:UDP-2,3-diacylglucosamine pyrophosphatase LpxH